MLNRIGLDARDRIRKLDSSIPKEEKNFFAHILSVIIARSVSSSPVLMTCRSNSRIIIPLTH